MASTQDLQKQIYVPLKTIFILQSALCKTHASYNIPTNTDRIPLCLYSFSIFGKNCTMECDYKSDVLHANAPISQILRAPHIQHPNPRKCSNQ